MHVECTKKMGSQQNDDNLVACDGQRMGQSWFVPLFFLLCQWM